MAYALFCFTLAVSLDGLGIAASFGLAVVVALVTQAIALALTQRGRGPLRGPDPAAQAEALGGGY